VVNTALTELTSEMAQAAMEGKIRKDLKAAFELAAEQYPLEHFKDILKKFEEEVTAHEEAVKAAAATPKKSKKGKAKETTDEDVEMEDAGESSKAKTKKRKAEDDSSVSYGLQRTCLWEELIRAFRPLSVLIPSRNRRSSSTPLRRQRPLPTVQLRLRRNLRLLRYPSRSLRRVERRSLRPRRRSLHPKSATNARRFVRHAMARFVRKKANNSYRRRYSICATNSSAVF
jgi:hypothetical protein